MKSMMQTSDGSGMGALPVHHSLLAEDCHLQQALVQEYRTQSVLEPGSVTLRMVHKAQHFLEEGRGQDIAQLAVVVVLQHHVEVLQMPAFEEASAVLAESVLA